MQLAIPAQDYPVQPDPNTQMSSASERTVWVKNGTLAPNFQSLACTPSEPLSGTRVILRDRQSEHHRTSRGRSLASRRCCDPCGFAHRSQWSTVAYLERNLAATATMPCTEQLGMRGLGLGRSQPRSQPEADRQDNVAAGCLRSPASRYSIGHASSGDLLEARGLSCWLSPPSICRTRRDALGL